MLALTSCVSGDKIDGNMSRTRREMAPRVETARKKTGEELLEEASLSLGSLEADIEAISKGTPRGRIKVLWSEAKERIRLFRKAAEELIDEGIKMREDGNLKQGEEEIWSGISALIKEIDLHEDIIRSGWRVGGLDQEVRDQREEKKECLRRFLYLVLKAEILGYKNTPASRAVLREFRWKRREIRGELEKLERSLAKTEKEKRRVPEELNKQINKWKEELRKQKNRMRRERGPKTNGFY